MELKSLDTALSLLSHFSVTHQEWGVRALSQHSGVSPSVVQRILATFQLHGFLRQCPDTRRYRLGLRFWELGVVFRDQFQLGAHVADLLRVGADRTGETVYLNMLDGDEAVCVQTAESPESVKVAIRLGERTSLLAGSRGKVLLAFLDDERQRRILDAAFGAQAAVDARRTGLEQDLTRIRAQGWCLTHGERLADVVGLSVPIRDRQGRVFASVTVGGPALRMTEAKVLACVPVLLALGRELQDHFNKFE